jgi:hypothetical protein|tara:strand:- start:76 stop:396 length:321 start_codon:yes stop_codon:yes gene_type:complete
MPRDYQKENKYKAKPEQIKLRGIRNKARLAAIKSGKAKVGDGTSVEHIKPLSKGGKNTPKNTKLVSFADNSSFDRNSDKSVRKNTPGIFKKKTTKKKTTKKKTTKK